MDKLQKLKAAAAAKFAEMKAVSDGADADGGRSMTDEEQKQFEGFKAEFDQLQSQVATQNSIVEAQAIVDRNAATAAPVLPRQTSDASNVLDDAAAASTLLNGGADSNAALPIVLPASAQRYAGRLKAFSGANAMENAYSAGQWYRAISGNANAAQWCADHGMGLQVDNGQIEGDDSLGGYMVPTVIENGIIRLVESFGMFRQKAHIVPMTSETSNTNRRTGGVTAEFVGETQSATESTMSWDQIGLVAKAISAITIVSSELNADTIMSIGDQITVEIALAFSTKEDACGFNGTGTSAFGKIKGIIPRLLEINGVDDGGGLVLAAGATWASITLANMSKVTGATINLANATEEWYCSKPFFAQVMLPMKLAGGGNAVTDIESGGNRKAFLGYPVNISNSFPKATASAQIPCIFGDVSISSSFGDRMGMTLSTNTQGVVGNVNLFTSRQMAIMGVERFDINNHDLGDATNGGPVVGLITQ